MISNTAISIYDSQAKILGIVGTKSNLSSASSVAERINHLESK
jgi:hypothetical protein